MEHFSEDLQDLAATFVTLQKNRNAADYLPQSQYEEPDVGDVVARAESCIAVFEKADKTELRRFCFLLTLRRRT